MKYYVYVLYSVALKKRYVGQTEDLQERLKQHNIGKCRFTTSAKDWTIIHSELVYSRNQAVRREAYLKSGVGRKELDANIGNK